MTSVNDECRRFASMLESGASPLEVEDALFELREQYCSGPFADADVEAFCDLVAALVNRMDDGGPFPGCHRSAAAEVRS